MKDYIYDEQKYFNGDLAVYEDKMYACNYTPLGIQDDTEFQSLLEYLMIVLEQSPLFIPAYEYVLEMLDSLEPDEDLSELIDDLEYQRISNAMKVAEMDDIFNKKVEWGWLENRPLIRAIYYFGYSLWEQGDINEGHEMFSMLYKTNENDEVGARFSMKATKVGMSAEEFDKRFVEKGDEGTYYKMEELLEWYDG